MITPGGSEAVGPGEPRPTGYALLSFWAKRLESEGAKKVWEAIREAHPNRLTAPQIGEWTEMSTSGGSWGRAMKELRARGMVDGAGSPRAFGMTSDLAAAAGI